MDIVKYADQVWSGEVADSVVRAGLSGTGVVEVADDVGFRAGFGNTVVVRDGGEAALFDTGNPYDAERLRQDVRAWTADPVTTVVHSHGHIDHVSGVGPFDAEADAAGRPRPVVAAHEAVAARFDRYLLTRGYNAVVNRRQFQLEELSWPSEYRYPDVDYRSTLTAGPFALFHGKGETEDASVGFLPERRVLLPGDLFIWLAPNCGNPQKAQRYPREWAVALRRMAALDAEIMLPGHGAPIFGADRIEQALTETAEWLESLVEQTLALLNEGARLDTAIQRVRPPARLADRPYLRPHYDEPEFVVRTIWRLYGGWHDGNPAHLKPAPDAVLAGAVAELAGGAGKVGEAALRALEAGDQRLAGHLAEMAVQAAPDDAALHRIRAEVFAARARSEDSLMARGVFAWAAAESRERSE
ncbi:alkyl sulfatase dimerization domain-containing protein [Nonomuraea roseoviolacea]|uniref:Alkyl sulfatase BDS1-like metallo-beta-lactamase superfamily hydrolase n=1 Tax=Nonomuraea roseoviolacea subsp. carminata TaxID=160689 RepID=A0ABT1KFW6_9ACTN|nr:alkyl sulfatase dimerization domain-containing protein [Nonomuraea roseoviolacea]MCP2352910.1 alkyl sulfatase BDS1-like metallo-beta-lactamase superfamily hydrolase [Nonomuraea roseoviolacea subsp. carminata]